MGTLDKLSTPPEITTRACPRAIWSAPCAMAEFADAHARLTEAAGMLVGNCGNKLTSRATFGVNTLGTTWPKYISSTKSPSRSIRCTSSIVVRRASSTAGMSLRRVPALQNGLLQPPITATRSPFRGEFIWKKVLTLVAGVQGETSFATHGNDACECGGARVERFEDLAGEQHLEWRYE